MTTCSPTSAFPGRPSKKCAGLPCTSVRGATADDWIREDAVDRGYVARETVAGAAVRVAVTEGGAKFLRAHGRVS